MYGLAGSRGMHACVPRLYICVITTQTTIYHWPVCFVPTKKQSMHDDDVCMYVLGQHASKIRTAV
jgi:hypothetical protein